MTDTHAHLYDEAFDCDADTIISECRKAGIGRIVTPAVDGESYGRMNTLADRYPDYLFPTIGLHPTSIDGGWKTALTRTEALLESDPDRYVAIGEVGMDLYWSSAHLREQCEALGIQAMWSLSLRKPLILHVRNAYSEIFPVLEPFAGKLTGVFHSFEGTAADLARIDRLGHFYIGAGGVMTYKKRVARLLGESVPLDRIVLETDSPYLCPSRGERNSPLYLPVIIDALCRIYGTDEKTVIQTTDRNAEKLFSFRNARDAQ